MSQTCHLDLITNSGKFIISKKKDLIHYFITICSNLSLCRFNIQKANLAGPNSLKPVSTSGKPLPTPIDIEGQLSPTSGTSIKLSWNLPNDTKNRNYKYGVYYGVNYKEILTGDPETTTDTTIMIKGLHACEKYSFVVAIVGPQSFGPPSVPISVSTKFSPGAPPKNLQVNSLFHYVYLFHLGVCTSE